MKKILSLALALVMLATISVGAFAYTDTIPDWAKQAVGQYGSLIVPGSGVFDVSANVTRKEFAHVVNAIAKYPATVGTFTDTADTDVGALQKAGVILGRDNGKTFDPDGLLTREEAARILGIAFGVPVAKNATTKYNDNADINDWAKPYIDSLTTFSYLKGDTENKFNPKSNLTRAEVCQIAYNVNPGAPVENANYVVTKAETLKDQKFNNLVIAAGITGEVVLEDVTVNGSVVVLGNKGAANSGTANVGKVGVAALGAVKGTPSNSALANAAFTLTIKGKSVVGQLFVEAVANINIDAKVGNVVIQQSAVTVVVGTAGEVAAVVVSSTTTAVEVDNKGTITTMTVLAVDTVIVNEGTITTAAVTEAITITGDGKVETKTEVSVTTNDIYA